MSNELIRLINEVAENPNLTLTEKVNRLRDNSSRAVEIFGTLGKNAKRNFIINLFFTMEDTDTESISDELFDILSRMTRDKFFQTVIKRRNFSQIEHQPIIMPGVKFLCVRAPLSCKALIKYADDDLLCIILKEAENQLYLAQHSGWGPQEMNAAINRYSGILKSAENYFDSEESLQNCRDAGRI